MKRAILLLILGGLTLPTRAEELQWLTDVPTALEKAKRENKTALLNFTGSDWCPTCMKLKSEVFDSPGFARFAPSAVLVEVDFPRHKPMAAVQARANYHLLDVYHISSFPTVVVLDPEGKEVGKIDYRPGGSVVFIARVLNLRFPNTSSPPLPEEPPAPPPPPRKPVVFTPPPPSVPNHYDSLALKGISGTRDRRMVLINNATLTVGETANVRVQDHEVVVSCKAIRDNSVLVTVNDKPMELKLGTH